MKTANFPGNKVQRQIMAKRKKGHKRDPFTDEELELMARARMERTKKDRRKL